MKHMIKKFGGKMMGGLNGASHFSFFMMMAAVVALVAPVDPALATSGLGDLMTAQTGSQMPGIVKGAMLIFGVIGFVMVGVGFLKWRTAKQTGEGMGGVMSMILIGALLMSIPMIIGIFSTTIFGTTDSSAVMDQLVK